MRDGEQPPGCLTAILRLIGINLQSIRPSGSSLPYRLRDEFLDRAFAAAGLPLLHFPAQRQYDTRAIAVALEAALQGGTTKAIECNTTVATGRLPHCPKCDAEMVVRTAQRGPNQGKDFYACPNFPKCRTTLAITDRWAKPRAKAH
jgi:hypothetical protein